jgi:hypothetical protein
MNKDYTINDHVYAKVGGAVHGLDTTTGGGAAE